MLKDILRKAIRVFKVARKPDRSEYLDVAKVAGIGVLLIGTIGFAIMMIRILVGGGVP